MHNCKICLKEFKSAKSLIRHISQSHKDLKTRNEIPTKVYYDLFLKKNNEDICKVCGNKNKWQGFTTGYFEACCRSHSAILYRKRLKQDSKKFNEFTDKVKINQENIWAIREETGEKQLIIDKATKTRQEDIDKMTPEERKETFGWLNKLNGEERQKAIKKMTKGMIEWHNNLSYKEKKDFYKRRAESLRKTWEERGDEISDKINKSYINNLINNSNEEIDYDPEIDLKESKIFNLKLFCLLYNVDTEKIMETLHDYMDLLSPDEIADIIYEIYAR